MVNEHPAGSPDKIDRGVHDVRIATGDKVLVEFIADAVEAGAQNAEDGNLDFIVTHFEGRKRPVKQNPQYGISEKMQILVKEWNLRRLDW